MTKDHTLQVFDKSLEALFGECRTMADLVVSMVDRCRAVIERGEQATAQQVIADDLAVDRLEEAIHEEVLVMVASLAPVASDLREMLAAERVASNLERVGDHAKNIAKRCMTSPLKMSAENINLLLQLQSVVLQMLRQVLDAFGERDSSVLKQAFKQDARADELFDDFFHSGLAELSSAPQNGHMIVNALFVAKSLERIGDHATNIAEEIRFMERGEIPAATREPEMP